MMLSAILRLSVVTAVPTFLVLAALIKAQRSYGMGQWVRDLGPKKHAIKKGTPSAGGLAIIVGQTIGLITAFDRLPDIISLYLFGLWGGGLIGLYDDSVKILRLSSGISMRSKMLGLTTLALCQIGLSFSAPATLLPGYGFISLPLSIFIILSLLAYTGTSNAVNLTDGLDGLVSGVLLSFWCVMLFLCEQLTPLALTWQWPMQELLILCWINLVSIGCFMSLNYYPAMIFMGDSGALALGSAIAAVFCYLKSPLLLIVLLFVPVIEALSVILQISSFKLFKKRIFKMAPLHHHFELSGYSETSVMLSLSALNLVVALVGLYFFWTARGTFLGL